MGTTLSLIVIKKRCLRGVKPLFFIKASPLPLIKGKGDTGGWGSLNKESEANKLSLFFMPVVIQSISKGAGLSLHRGKWQGGCCQTGLKISSFRFRW